MKRPRNSMLATLCAMALASAGASAHDPYPGVEGHDMPHGNCAAMTTGNADQDFALRMHHHHAMAARLANDELARGTDPDLRAMAQAHLAAHTADQARLEAWLTARNVDFRAWGRPAGWPYGTFVQVDSNGDGYLDRTEVVTTSPWHPYFTPMDANGDGRITPAESDAYTRAWRPGPWQGWTFVGVDSNRDGFIDRTEVVATSPMHPHFDQIDSNDDGRATQAEVETFWRTMKHSGGGHAMHCEGMPGMPDMAHDAGADAPRDVSDKGPAPAFRSSDRNGDGFLARDELASGDMLLGHFTAADSNNDGRLSSGEVDAHHAVMAEMGKD